MSSSDQNEPRGTSASTPAERRRTLRFPVSATVEAVEVKTGAKITGRTTDLGLGGCYIDTMNPFPVGAEVKVRIQRENESFEAQARVVYSLAGMGMGMAFVSAQAKQIRLFQRWIQEISGESAPLQPPGQPTPVETTQTMQHVVLTDLIMTLMQKKVLTETEGKDLLRKLFV